MMNKFLLNSAIIIITAFFLNPLVYSKELARDTQIDGYLFKAGTKVEFYESGSIKYAWLKEPMEVYGILCSSASRIDFYEAGGIKRAALADTQEVQDIEFLPKSELCFYESGRLERVGLIGPQKINDYMAAGSWVEFYENGNIAHITLAEGYEYNINSYHIIGGTDVVFNPDGSLERIKPPVNYVITDNIEAAKAHWVIFYNTGEIKQIRLAKETKIKSEIYPKNTLLYFDKYLNVLKAEKQPAY
jgi:antitoxin component YwqK of YwqJK toxin-antitoxin module